MSQYISMQQLGQMMPTYPSEGIFPEEVIAKTSVPWHLNRLVTYGDATLLVSTNSRLNRVDDVSLRHFEGFSVFLYLKGAQVAETKVTTYQQLENTLPGLYQAASAKCHHLNAKQLHHSQTQCLTVYECLDCGHQYTVDSSD